MRLILTRHGQTCHNALGLSMGQGIDGVLNEEGMEQARCVAERLRGEHVTSIYTSNLRRATYTAKIIRQYHPRARMMSEPALRERRLGIYEGRPNTEWKVAMEASTLPFHLYQPQGGESYDEVYKRICILYERLLSEAPNETILLVSHTGTLTMLLLRVFGLSITRENYERHKPGNTAVTILEYQGQEPIVHALNSVDHLHQDKARAA